MAEGSGWQGLGYRKMSSNKQAICRGGSHTTQRVLEYVDPVIEVDSMAMRAKIRPIRREKRKDRIDI